MKILSEPAGMLIQDISRAMHTKRWTIVNTTMESNLASHSWMVAQIAIEICNRNPEWKSLLPSVVLYAMNHDIDELLWGDIPTHTKNRLKEEGADLGFMYTRGGKTWYDPVAVEIVKAADIVENAWFIATYGHGRHAKKISAMMDDKVHQIPGKLGAVSISVLYALLEGDLT